MQEDDSGFLEGEYTSRQYIVGEKTSAMRFQRCIDKGHSFTLKEDIYAWNIKYREGGH